MGPSRVSPWRPCREGKQEKHVHELTVPGDWFWRSARPDGNKGRMTFDSGASVEHKEEENRKEEEEEEEEIFTSY